MDMPFRIMITGGAGFIGSHVAELLVRSGASVALVDNLDAFYPIEYKRANLAEISRVGKARVYESDIRNFEAMHSIFAAERPEILIHLAARAGVRPSISQPKLYEEVNVAGTLNLLDLAQRFKVRKFVFGSSSSVYGADSCAPFREDTAGFKPISPYAATKLAGEVFCYTYSHLYRLSVVCLRFFTVYGPRQRPDLAIHKFTRLMAAGKPIPILGDGSSGRDYTYVDDIVQGILAAIFYETDFDIFNLGNSNPVELLELVRLLEGVLEKRATLTFFPAQAGDVPLTWAEISKAQRLLGYRPRVPLQTGLEKFWSWFQWFHSRKVSAAPRKVATR